MHAPSGEVVHPPARIDAMIGDVLLKGYRFDIDPNGVARAVLGKSTWAVLALTLDIELFTRLHYRQSIDPDPVLSELFKDAFLYGVAPRGKRAAAREAGQQRAPRKRARTVWVAAPGDYRP